MSTGIDTNDFHGLWRASANEAMPYTEDYPEALLVLPEFIDGSALNIFLKFKILFFIDALATEVLDLPPPLSSEKETNI